MKKRPISSFFGRVAVLIVGLASAASTVSADSFGTLGNLTQSQFVEFSEDLGSATHYKAVSPPETLGLLGLDVGVVVSSTDISGDLFDLASDGGFDGSDLIIPRVHVQKGLPFGIDLGASVGVIPDSDAKILAAEARYAIIDGGAVKPALGLRATYSQVTGLDDLGMKSYALELGVSKGFLMLTPYAGVGIVRSTATPENIDTLMSETFEQRKIVVGATVNLGVALTLEAERTGDNRTYSAKLGFRF